MVHDLEDADIIDLSRRFRMNLLIPPPSLRRQVIYNLLTC